MIQPPRTGSGVLFAASIALLSGCGGPKKVTTDNGTFDVPGAAQTKAGSLGFSTMESGCEIPGGGVPLKLTDVKTTGDGDTKRTLFHIERAGCPAGWIDARLVFPAAAGAAR